MQSISRHSPSLILAALALFSASPLPAAELPGAGALADLVMRFDTSGDSRIDAGEWQNGVVMSFEEIDRDRDGKITASEVEELGGELEKEAGSIVSVLVPKVIKPIIMGMDGDKDGAVSRDEFTKRVEEIFAKVDENKDSYLTRGEAMELPLKVLVPEKK